MKRVDHAFDSIPLIKNPAPPPLSAVGRSIPGRPMNHDVHMLGRVVTVKTLEWEFEVEVLDSGEDATDLYEQDKYGEHLGAAAIEALKGSRHPVAFPIYACKVLRCTPLVQTPPVSPADVGDTLAIMDNHRF